MNHKLIRMLNEAGFNFTPDVMAKLPEFEKLVGLEREACAKLCEQYETGRPEYHAETLARAIRARGQDGD